MDNLTGLIAVAGAFLVVLIPVAGLTARFAFKPVIEAAGRSFQARQQNDALQLAERRIALLEREMTAMREDLQRIADGKSFDAQLAASASASSAADRPTLGS